MNYSKQDIIQNVKFMDYEEKFRITKDSSMIIGMMKVSADIAHFAIALMYMKSAGLTENLELMKEAKKEVEKRNYFANEELELWFSPNCSVAKVFKHFPIFRDTILRNMRK
jgi:hypothetical protein